MKTVSNKSITTNECRSNVFLVRLGYVFVSYLSAAPFPSLSYLHGALISMMIRLAHAGPVLALRAWIQAVISATIINNRVYSGLVLVSIVAPLSACVHMVFNKDSEIVGWYYFSYFYLFLVLGPYFFCLCIITAAFFWIPPSTQRIKISKRDIKFQLTRVLSIPFGVIAGKIIWLCQVDSHNEFHQLPSLISLLSGLVLGYIIIRVLEYLVWRQEHVMNALIDSLDGLYNNPHIENKEKIELGKPYWNELRKFNSKY